MWPMLGATLLLVGCNLVFEAKAGPDAPGGLTGDGDPGVGCPAGAPVLRGQARRFSTTRCTHYTQSRASNTATAVCGGQPVEAPLDDATFAMIKVIPPGGRLLDDIRISPAGDELYATTSSAAATDFQIDVFQRTGTEWTFLGPTNLPAGTAGAPDISAPSLGAAPTILIDPSGVPDLEEWTLEGPPSTWRFVRSYLASDFGVMAIRHPSMTADGLRMVFVGQTNSTELAVYHAQRSSTLDPFADLVRLDLGSIALPEFPYLRDDCERLYLTQLTEMTFIPSN